MGFPPASDSGASVPPDSTAPAESTQPTAPTAPAGVTSQGAAPAAAPTPDPAPAPAHATSSGYPVQLTVTDARELNRLWGVPYFGILVRCILAIPHIIILALLGLGMYVVMALGWIPILLLGRVPGIQAAWIKETVHRANRIVAYTYFLFPGGYPPFGPGAPSPVALTIDLEGRSMSRLWGIPILGFIVRYIVLIPHLIVLAILFLVAAIAEIVLWIPILLLGRYPGWAISLFGGVLRYLARVQCYLMLLPVPYPPFSFS